MFSYYTKDCFHHLSGSDKKTVKNAINKDIWIESVQEREREVCLSFIFLLCVLLKHLCIVL